ncbi:MAG: nucleocapsid [Pastinaca cytorhabdovirus 1]|uniref:Nucleoprotein n=1 Tax=Pastinaca cytorhabdovirus 1 TaxID=2950847 RepID=A0AAE9SK18_9RHAB|nr:MAG: nucleocapsid [Pastinaca cytorhabdovirus 1]
MALELTDAQRKRLAQLRAKAQPAPKQDAPKTPSVTKPKVLPLAKGEHSVKIVPTTNTKYSDVDEIELTVSRMVDTWKDSDFNTLKIYEIQQLTDDELNLFGRAVVNAINSDEITSDIVFMMLYMAISLRSTADIAENLLVDINPHMTNMIQHSRPEPTVDVDILEDEDAEELAKLQRKLREKRNAEQKVNDALASTSRPVRNDDPVTNKTSSASCYAYMSAFLLRLYSRDPESLVSKFETAKMRFAGFYDDGKDVLDELRPNVEAFKMIRDILARKPEIISTWVAWVAYSENEKTLVKQDRGLLEYLALQVFAYQGMHAVVQILAIHQISKYPMGSLLREMDSRMTRSAVKEVHLIIRDFHRNARHPNRKTYFRYARVWDEGYFSKVQSKNCAQLLYLAAKTVKELSPNSNSDPTQIYAVKNMSDTMKAQLDAVSNKLLMLILSSVDDEETGQIWKN